MVLICFSLMAIKMHFFSCFAIHIFLMGCLNILSLGILFAFLLLNSYIFLVIKYIFFLHRYKFFVSSVIGKYIFQVCTLSFHFLKVVFHRAQVLNFG